MIIIFRFISQKFCIAFVFALLWLLYYSLYQIGQTFMWFQWQVNLNFFDINLLFLYLYFIYLL